MATTLSKSPVLHKINHTRELFRQPGTHTMHTRASRGQADSELTRRDFHYLWKVGNLATLSKCQSS